MSSKKKKQKTSTIQQNAQDAWERVSEELHDSTIWSNRLSADLEKLDLFFGQMNTEEE